MVIAVPTGVKVFSWLATMWAARSSSRRRDAVATGFVLLFTIGGVTCVQLANPSLDRLSRHLLCRGALPHVLSLGAAFAIFAGFYYWFPK